MATVKEKEECHFFWTQELLFKDDSKYGPNLQYSVSFCTYFDICTRICFFLFIQDKTTAWKIFIILHVRCTL